MEKRSLLIEIGTEELPPKALKSLAEALAEGIDNGLKKARLEPTSYKYFAAPRRLAVLLDDVPLQQTDQPVTQRGPSIQAAYDNEGNPSKAATGFARSCGVEVDQLGRLKTDKGEWLVHTRTEEGRPTTDCLKPIIEKALADLPIPKRMRWGDSDHEFVRPVHWVTIVFGNDPVALTILGLEASHFTFGHRFHAPDPLPLDHADRYEPLLRESGYVIADFEQRKTLIETMVQSEADRLNAQPILNDDLLDEVTALVEWPVAITGGFEPEFLDIPAEALITTMQDHQKYFPLVDQNQTLMPHFITISNIESQDPDVVRKGNERVVRPRLADAAFFWEQDQKQPLLSRQSALKRVIFQNKLGTVYEKVQRIALLSSALAGYLHGDQDKAERAAQLSKCDLVTEMVGEFASLQGTMGKYYATLEGEDSEVAKALDEQYMPRFAGDQLPTSACGQALALADKIDTLVGIFAIGQKPSGNSDPYGLRRSALGVLRILIEKRLSVDLAAMLQLAADGLSTKLNSPDAVNDVLDFMMERLRGYYNEQGYRPQLFEAVHALGVTNPLDFDERIKAVKHFSELPEAESLAAANKRISNILKKVEGEQVHPVNPDNLIEPAEKTLYEQIETFSATAQPCFQEGRYTEGLQILAQLKHPVDHFFDSVMVMAEDKQLKSNRIALLTRLRDLFSTVADLSLLPAE